MEAGIDEVAGVLIMMGGRASSCTENRFNYLRNAWHCRRPHLWESSLPVIRVCRLLMGGNERTHRTR